MVSIGEKKAVEQIRTALAMGADRGVHVTTDLRLDQELQVRALAWPACRGSSRGGALGP